MLSGADIERIKEALMEEDGDTSSYITELTISGMDSSFIKNKKILNKIANAEKLSLENTVDLIKIVLYGDFSTVDKRDILSTMIEKISQPISIVLNLTVHELFLLIDLDDVCFEFALIGFNEYDDLYAIFTHPKSENLLNNTHKLKKVLKFARLGEYIMSAFPQKRKVHDLVKYDSTFAVWFREFMSNESNKKKYKAQSVVTSNSKQYVDTYTFQYARFLCIGQLYVPSEKTLIIKDLETKNELFKYHNEGVGKIVDINRVYFDKVEIVENYLFKPPSGQEISANQRIMYA